MSLLKVTNVGKAYRSYQSEWMRIFGWFRRRIKPTKEHWVIRNITFEVGRGESIGVIGRNGAGKSTLLKIIAKTLEPSEGNVETSGTIAAILELGMGFDRELSGRANVIHAAGLMGIEPNDHPALVACVMTFAELGDYFDQPLRTYSSGMSARLAFALATAYRPDLLIVDEALSVGDDAFRRKCFARIEEYLAQGTSLLLVSHSAEQIRRFCTRAIYLDKHQVIGDGAPKDVCALYEKDTFSGFIEHKSGILSGLSNSEIKNADKSHVDGLNLRAKIISVSLLNDIDQEINMVPTGMTARLRLKIEFCSFNIKPAITLGIKTPDGVRVYAAVFKKLEQQSGGIAKYAEYTFRMKTNLLPSAYFVTVGLSDVFDGSLRPIHHLSDELMFRVYSTYHTEDKVEIGMASLELSLEN